MIKFSVSSYSFSQYIHAGKLTLMECIGKAKEMGFDGIEFIEFGGEDPIKTAGELKAECERVGIEVSNYAFGGDFLVDSEKAVEAAKRHIDIAAALGTKTVRHDVTGGVPNRTFEGYDNVVEKLADCIREVTIYAESKGIRTTTENHGYFSQDSMRVEKLVNTVAHKNFGLLCDMGNFLCADEDPAQAFGRLAPYAFYVHAKDFIVKDGNLSSPGEGFFSSRNGNFLRGTIIGHGDVPVKHCIRALRHHGYKGYIAIEFEGMEDCVQGIRIGLANLKNYVQN